MLWCWVWAGQVREGFLEVVIPELDIEGWRQGFQKQRTQNGGMKIEQHLLSMRAKEREGVKNGPGKEGRGQINMGFFLAC